MIVSIEVGFHGKTSSFSIDSSSADFNGLCDALVNLFAIDRTGSNTQRCLSCRGRWVENALEFQNLLEQGATKFTVHDDTSSKFVDNLSDGNVTSFSFDVSDDMLDVEGIDPHMGDIDQFYQGHNDELDVWLNMYREPTYNPTPDELEQIADELAKLVGGQVINTYQQSDELLDGEATNTDQQMDVVLNGNDPRTYRQMDEFPDIEATNTGEPSSLGVDLDELLEETPITLGGETSTYGSITLMSDEEIAKFMDGVSGLIDNPIPEDTGGEQPTKRVLVSEQSTHPEFGSVCSVFPRTDIYGKIYRNNTAKLDAVTYYPPEQTFTRAALRQIPIWMEDFERLVRDGKLIKGGRVLLSKVANMMVKEYHADNPNFRPSIPQKRMIKPRTAKYQIINMALCGCDMRWNADNPPRGIVTCHKLPGIPIEHADRPLEYLKNLPDSPNPRTYFTERACVRETTHCEKRDYPNKRTPVAYSRFVVGYHCANPLETPDEREKGT